jgi:AGCS family alanine or glycine:cation symporter
VWGTPTLIFFLATAFYLSLRTGFIQFRKFPESWRAISTPEPGQENQGGEISPLKSFLTMLAGAIGSGNIAGVATAVASGGPGAIFWMWVAGSLCMALKFTEAVLGFHFREREPDGRYSAGPMYYLRDGLGWKGMAAVFAFVAGAAAVSTGPMVQSNTITTVLESQFGFNRLYAGIVLTVAVWIVVIGGLRTIAAWAEKLVPLKLILYVGGSIVVFGVFIRQVPEALALVFSHAFTPAAAVGGFVGATFQQAVRFGCARGVYANEAGLGTAAYMYGVSKSRDPVRQGLIAMLDCFVISFITCTASAMVVVTTGVWSSGLQGAPLVAAGFNAAMPQVGGWIVAVSATLFAYTNLIGWSYYGEKSFEFILGRKVAMPYRWTYCLIIPIGSVSEIRAAWYYGDFMNGIQAILNLVAVLLLAGVAVQVLHRKRPATASGV